MGVVGLLKNKTKLSPARATLLGLSLAISSFPCLHTRHTPLGHCTHLARNTTCSELSELARTLILTHSRKVEQSAGGEAQTWGGSTPAAKLNILFAFD